MAASDVISLGIGSPAGIRAFILAGLTGNANVPPVILSGNVPGGYQNIAYSFQLVADSDGPVTWSVTVGALPTGLSLSAAGVISGTPTLIESQTFTVQASNAAGDDTQQLTIPVIAAGTSRPSFSAGDILLFRF